MAAFVTFAMFSDRYGGDIPGADEIWIEALLVDACGLVEDLIGDTYTASTVPVTTVAAICASVRRAYDNPSGLVSETIGDYTWRTAFSGTSAAGKSGIYLTPEERRNVRRAAGQLSATSLTLTSNLPAPTVP